MGHPDTREPRHAYRGSIRQQCTWCKQTISGAVAYVEGRTYHRGCVKFMNCRTVGQYGPERTQSR